MLFRVDTHSLLIEHDHICSADPRRCEVERHVMRELRVIGLQDVPPLEHGWQFVLLGSPVVGVHLLSGACHTWPLGVEQHLAGHERCECPVDVHCILVLEVQEVESVAGELPGHPLHAELVGDLRTLAEDVPAHAREVCGVEHGFELIRAVSDRLAVLGFDPVVVLRFIAHLRFRSCNPIAALEEVFFAQFAELSVFKKSTSPSHRSFNYGISDGYQYIPGHCGVKLIFAFKIGRFDRAKIFFYIDFGSSNFHA